MDIAITLPRSLWNKIVSGEKSIELRKVRPNLFNAWRDRVYVVTKGSNEVVGYFYIECFMATTLSCLMVSHRWLEQIAVSQEWVSTYIEGSKLIYLWFIGKCVSFNKSADRNFDMRLKNNPQCFTYIE